MSPGFAQPWILAVANAVGPESPKTNVARSALEDTVERKIMLSVIYDLYAKHISNEIVRLCTDEQFSLTRAVREASYQAADLANSDAPSNPAALEEANSRIPLIIVEDDKARKNISLEEMITLGSFWTVEFPLFRSVETFIQEAPTNVRADTLFKTLGNAESAYPPGTVACNLHSSPFSNRMISSSFDISEAVASAKLRRLDLRWTKSEKHSRWISTSSILTQVRQIDTRFYDGMLRFMENRRHGTRNRFNRLYLPIGPATFTGFDEADGFICDADVYLKPGTPAVEFAQNLLMEEGDNATKKIACYIIILYAYIGVWEALPNLNEDNIRRIIDEQTMLIFRPFLEILGKVVEVGKAVKGSLFDPYAWDRDA